MPGHGPSQSPGRTCITCLELGQGRFLRPREQRREMPTMQEDLAALVPRRSRRDAALARGPYSVIRTARPAGRVFSADTVKVTVMNATGADVTVPVTTVTAEIWG
jgi:hypothetical protein